MDLEEQEGEDVHHAPTEGDDDEFDVLDVLMMQLLQKNRQL